MAELKFALFEILDLIKSNQTLNSHIGEAAIEGDSISFHYNTGMFFPRSIPVSLQFRHFTEGSAFFRISVSSLPEAIMKMIPLPRNNPYLFLKYPDLEVRLNRITGKYLPGIEIKDVQYNNGLFTVIFSTERSES